MHKFFFIIWLLYSTGLIYPDIERYVFYNEFFVLVGFSLSFHFISRKYTSLTKVELVYFSFIIYGFILLLASSKSIISTGAYLSLRTMPIFYNVFAFMLGYYLYSYHLVEKEFVSSKKWAILSIAMSIITPWRLTPQVFAMYFLQSYKAIFCYLILFSFVNGGATSLTAFLFVSILYFHKNTLTITKWCSKKYLYSILISFFTALYFSDEIYNSFISTGYEDVFALDVNFTWRYMFWVYLFQDVIVNNLLFGIGFGTPLFDLDTAPNFLTSDDGTRNTEYTLGTHNSLVFLLARMGGIGLFLVLSLHVLIYSKAFKAIKANKNNKISEIESILLANLMFLNSAFFNVILETPLYGGLYWLTLGLLYGSLKMKGYF